MDQSGGLKLRSLLTGGGQTLLNFKFLPGDNPSSGDAICETAHRWLEQAFAYSGENVLPSSAVEQVSIGDLIGTL